mmetsp:Transcript_36196/g.103434  ORF Transcript_36196/g.103434 Transcript_36196/m.103434 type:complete len:279 (+) Transcript_36196:539-1375(+)
MVFEARVWRSVGHVPDLGIAEGTLHDHRLHHRRLLLSRDWLRRQQQDLDRVLRRPADRLQPAGLGPGPPHGGAVLRAPGREARARAGPRQLRLAGADGHGARGVGDGGAPAQLRRTAQGLPRLRPPGLRRAVARLPELLRGEVPEPAGVRGAAEAHPGLLAGVHPCLRGACRSHSADRRRADDAVAPHAHGRGALLPRGGARLHPAVAQARDLEDHHVLHPAVRGTRELLGRILLLLHRHHCRVPRGTSLLQDVLYHRAWGCERLLLIDWTLALHPIL